MKISKHQSPGTREYPIPNHEWDEPLMLNGQSGKGKHPPNDQWDEPMVLKDESGEGRHPFDLEERTSRFGEQIILFAKKIPENSRNRRLIDQLIGAGTSIGAN